MEDEENLTKSEKVNAVFKRLRARLFSLMETALEKDQASAAKKSIRDYTSQAWNDVTGIIDDE